MSRINIICLGTRPKGLPRALRRITKLRSGRQECGAVVHNFDHPAHPMCELSPERERARATRAGASTRPAGRTRVVAREPRRHIGIRLKQVCRGNANQRGALSGIAVEVPLPWASRPTSAAGPEEHQAIQMRHPVLERTVAQAHVVPAQGILVSHMDILRTHPYHQAPFATLADEPRTAAGFHDRGGTLQPSHSTNAGYVRGCREVVHARSLRSKPLLKGASGSPLGQGKHLPEARAHSIDSDPRPARYQTRSGR